MRIKPMIQLARPSHWIKNIVVLMPVVFGMQVHLIGAWGKAIVAAAAFCCISSFAYILIDIKDRQSDRSHPVKKNRPLASSQISISTAATEAFVFLLLAMVLAQNIMLLFAILAYLLLQVLYTLVFKKKALLDVILISLGFVLRAAAGAVAIKVAISPWLFICMFTICLFMGFCKRYSETTAITDIDSMQSHRPTLLAYTPELLTHLITLSAAIAVTAFLLYGLHERTVEQFGTNYFIYTLPFVVYAVFRFAMLSMKGSYLDPTDIMLKDRPFQMTILLWAACMVGIIFYGKSLACWIQNFY
jgi:decaprenyl-phosphate phosphoribosyltransferase